jgi:OOP family OmpA-OmpF porin
VELALAGDTLRASGTAPLDWIASARRLGAVIPGVSALDLGGVTSELPAPLGRLRQEIEGERILFSVGSAALRGGAAGVLTRAAERFLRLESGASALGARVTLELVGRTDPTGSDSANQTLSRERADAVLGALAARGVPAGAVTIRALGTTQPLPGSDSAERARINRSVSLVVNVGREDGGESSR